MTLDEQKLVPAALVHLSWESKDLSNYIQYSSNNNIILLDNKPTIDLLKKQTIEVAKENEAKQEKPKAVEEEIRASSGKEEEVDKKAAPTKSANAPVPKWLKMGNKR